MKTIQIPERLFLDKAEFLREFAGIMRFPPSLGQNWDGWIDCMSSIDAPEEKMTEVVVGEDESLEIEILLQDGRYDKTEVWSSFSSCVAALNGRFSETGSKTRVVITEKQAPPGTSGPGKTRLA